MSFNQNSIISFLVYIFPFLYIALMLVSFCMAVYFIGNPILGVMWGLSIMAILLSFYPRIADYIANHS